MSLIARFEWLYRDERRQHAARALADEGRPVPFKVFRWALFVTFYVLSVFLFIYGLGVALSDVMIVSAAASVAATAGVFRYGLTEGAGVGVLFGVVFGPLVRGPVYDALNIIWDFSVKVVKRGQV